MKYLFFVSTFPALSETFILNQITGLIDIGHEVEIVACQRSSIRKYHPDVEKYDLMSKVTFIDVPSTHLKKLKKGFIVLSKTIFQKPKLCIEMLNVKKYGKIIFSLRPLLCIPFFTKNSSWDVIICHYGSNGLIGTIFQEQGLIQGKMITFFHGNDITGFVGKFGKNIYKPLFASQTLLLPISNMWKNKLIELGGNPKNIQIHHMGVDLNKFTYAPLKYESKKSIKILLVGRLTYKKGIDIAIESIYKLKGRGINVSLDIVGDGEEKEYLQSMIEQLNITNEVNLRGWLTQEQVNHAIEDATFIILPSRTGKNGDMEGIPVSLMEAMARGKLVISTYHSGIPELIQNEYNGWLVPENDSLALADKLMEVLSRKEMWDDVSYQARKTIQENFNVSDLNLKLTKMVQEEV